MTLSLRHHIDLLTSPDPVMMVSVAAVKGSTPREVGAFMLITHDATAGTIGGGNLEHQVTRRVVDAFAKQMDGKSDAAMLPNAEIVRFPLGPGLGQCCGGSVEVGFHLLDATQKTDLRDVLSEIACQPVSQSGRWVMLPVAGDAGGLHIAASDSLQAGMLASGFGTERGGIVTINGAETLCLRLEEALTPMWIFGAGHVGQALVAALEPLPFDVHLIDSRDDYLDGVKGENLHIHQSDKPQDEVADIPAGAHVLILTHNHALDFDICRAALMRGDLGFVGMIGSQTKRARFVRRLSDRGLGAAEIGRLTCPIGIQGITGKQPVVIAASVAAQVLSVREAQMAQNQTTKAASDGVG
ncbi:xanthine dehydrogenase accessory protein XdhC [Thalassospira sp.]|uniref:xanthine dehydrogenase accessory protein XdhC n=1 Tax=Thalassospira sp. TaxID=1912094 RepID=UPI0032F04961